MTKKERINLYRAEGKLNQVINLCGMFNGLEVRAAVLHAEIALNYIEKRLEDVNMPEEGKKEE